MNSFARVARIALRFRKTVIASIVTSFGIAFLWAFNFSALMPVVDGVMNGKAVPGLIEDRVARCNKQLAEIDTDIAASQKQLKIAEDVGLKRKLAALGEQRLATLWWRDTYEYVLPTATGRLPATPFGTLLLICGVIMVSTVIKAWLRIWNSWLVSKLGHLTSLELRKEFYRKTLRLDLGTLRQTTNGDLMTRFTSDMEWIGLGTQALYGMGIREPLKMVACLIGAALISWQLLLFTMISL